MIGRIIHGYRVTRADVAKAHAQGITVEQLLRMRRLYRNIVDAREEVALDLFEEAPSKLRAAYAAYECARAELKGRAA